ncbi:girdin-like isoform X2 [Rhopilema esculentum]|uniref:girdin-like isoform X2 n=1 Tax=Rhopilema esculentum TaxID=499914 RepID=UPI0031D569C2
MDNYLKESPRIRQCRKDEKKWLEYYKKHRKKMEEDRFATIDYENRKLLERIMNVVGDLPVTSKKKELKSPSKRTRSVQVSRIEEENKRFKERLDRTKAQVVSSATFDDVDPNAASRSKQKHNEEKQIMAENLRLQERIGQARSYISSAPAASEKMNYAREKQRLNDERKVMEENKQLKERINAARHRLNLTPPERNRPHASFQDRFKREAINIEQQNFRLHARLTEILESDPNYRTEMVDSTKRHQRLQRSFSEDNRVMQKRLEQIKSTIDDGKGHKENYVSEKKNAAARRYEEERIQEENKKMKKRILMIMESQNANASKRPGERDHSKQKKIDEARKSIEKENKLLLERIKKVKPVMSTRQKDQPPSFVPYNDQYQEMNKQLRKRLAKIKRGENPGPLKESIDLSDNDEDDQNDNEEEKKEGVAGSKKETKKGKKKVYQVPDGYHKKFRKRIKKNKKGDEVEDADDSEFETDSDYD